MTLANGSRFNSYVVGASLGAGGMGEVYRATDTKLKRDVALKVLPADFANDADRLARFQREAELLAALNHANIAQIFGIESADGITALVMELIDGPTLAERLEQGPLPLDEALNVALQICAALEAAHERQIVHRVLKPANIKLKSDGTVKVLDFGIAKAVDNQHGHSGPQAPMLTTPAMTQSGMILGTAAYMSPEQARGKTVDRRTDIWAFGCVLYEMLTGQSAFGGEDVQETLARVITSTLELRALPKTLPPGVRQALELCLVKDSKKRIADISDVRLALTGKLGASATEAVAVAAQPFWRRVLPVAAALITGGVAVGVVLWSTLQPQPQPLSRFAHVIPGEQEFLNAGRTLLAVAPDGRRFAYNTIDGIYVREFDDLDARLIPGTADELASELFFSPDGLSIGYVSLGTLRQLKRISVSGGAPVLIGDAGNGDSFGAHWAPDNTIFYSMRTSILRIPANGGAAEVVIEVPPNEQLASPELLPDGDTLIFTLRAGDANNWNEAQVMAVSLSSGERKVLVQGAASAHYVSSGHLLYAVENVLFGVPFDLDTLTVSGGAVPLAEGLSRAVATDSANYGVSRDGSLVYLYASSVPALRTLVWVDRAGAETPVPIEPGVYIYPRLAPDDSAVALDDRNLDNDIWVWSFAGETRTRLTIGPTGGYYPVWTPDGSHITYSTTGAGSIDSKAANNTGAIETLADNAQIFREPGTVELSAYFYSPDGKYLVFSPNIAGTRDIGMFTVGNAAEPVWLLNEPYQERNAELSPDGRWMAYESDESGSFEIYVRPFPNVNDDRVQVSNAGGIKPLWSRDGTELFYLEPLAASEFRLMGVAATPSENRFAFGTRTVLMPWPYLFTQIGRTYDISRDGQRFLALKSYNFNAEGEDVRQVVVVQNWLQELSRLIPTQ